METSGKRARGIEFQIAMSGGTRYQAEVVAKRIEQALDVKGSTIIPTIGRWDGETEDGFIVQVTRTGKNGPIVWTPEGGLSLLIEPMKRLRRDTGLTFYCTAREVQVMEVF